MRTERGAQSDGADRVENGAADAAGCEAVEGDATSLVKATSGFDQPKGAGASQLLTVDVAGEPDRDLQHDVVD